KEKRQSTAALQNLSDSKATAKLRKVLECGCALPLSLNAHALTDRFNRTPTQAPPEKLQAPITKPCPPRFEIWNLKLLWCLEVDACSFFAVRLATASLR